ncbi:MAG TPA: ATP-binding protein [Candidatus Baltobacteraceae bacterium]|nr:ATP-binding protein [Candidatus Baltobacteraceae bacterium]
MSQAAEQLSTDLVELRIPSRAEWVALARLAIAAVANRLRFSIEDIEDIKLAVAEACTAVIQHERHGEFIDLTCETSSNGLRVRVRDAGRQSSQPENGRLMDLDEARIAGLGVFLIRTLMDEVAYDVDPESGTDLVMVKRLQGQTA